MEDCKYAQICRYYGTTECYTDNNEEAGCFRERYFHNNLNDKVLEAESESEFFGRRE